MPPSIGCEWNPLITKGIVSKNSTDTQCSQLIKLVMKNKVAKVLLVGDSTMARLWAEARVFQSGEPSASKITETCGCDWLQDFGIKPSQVWGKPDHKEDGPAWKGVDKLQKNLCAKVKKSGRRPKVFLERDQLGQDIPGSKFVSMDLIKVIYARDLDMQSELGNTTQETLSRYLQLKHQMYPLCILNTGLHDQRLRGLETEDYVANVIEFLELMSPVCQHMIWIETTAPREDKKHPQTKARTCEWNTALYSYLDAHRHLNVSMMHVYEKSLKAGHNDNVHLHRSWYSEMARTLFEELYRDGKKYRSIVG